MNMNSFFGLTIYPQTVIGMTMVMLLSVIVGGLVGLERELHGHPAGLRTHILVCLGSTLMTLVSANMGHGSNDRISAQIVSGVGFLGAGAIIREGATVRGLTTAASIWGAAGIGIALGSAPFFGQIAVIAAIIIVFTLWGLTRIEQKIDAIGGRLISIQAVVSDSETASATLLAHISASGFEIRSVSSDLGSDKGTRHLDIRVTPKVKVDRALLIQDLISSNKATSINIL